MKPFDRTYGSRYDKTTIYTSWSACSRHFDCVGLGNKRGMPPPSPWSPCIITLNGSREPQIMNSLARRISRIQIQMGQGNPRIESDENGYWFLCESNNRFRRKYRFWRNASTHFGKEKDKLNLLCLRQLLPHHSQLAFHRSPAPIVSPTALVWDGDIEIDHNSC